MIIPVHDPLVRGQFFERHWPARVEFLRTHGDLCAESELPAIVEARRSAWRAPLNMVEYLVQRHQNTFDRASPE